MANNIVSGDDWEAVKAKAWESFKGSYQTTLREMLIISIEGLEEESEE